MRCPPEEIGMRWFDGISATIKVVVDTLVFGTEAVYGPVKGCVADGNRNVFGFRLHGARFGPTCSLDFACHESIILSIDTIGGAIVGLASIICVFAMLQQQRDLK